LYLSLIMAIMKNIQHIFALLQYKLSTHVNVINVHVNAQNLKM